MPSSYGCLIPLSLHPLFLFCSSLSLSKAQEQFCFPKSLPSNILLLLLLSFRYIVRKVQSFSNIISNNNNFYTFTRSSVFVLNQYDNRLLSFFWINRRKNFLRLKMLGVNILREEKQPQVTIGSVKRHTRKSNCGSSPSGYDTRKNPTLKMYSHIGLWKVSDSFPSKWPTLSV